MTASQHQTSDPAIIAQRPLPTQSGLDPNAIEWLLICAAQNRQLLQEVRSLIAPHHFTPREAPLRMVFEALCLSFDMYNGATYETLASIITDRLNQNHSIVMTDIQQQIIFRRDEQGLLWQICNPTGVVMDATNIAFARDLLRRFAHERTVVAPLRHVMNPGFNTGIPDLTDFLTAINNQQARLSTLNAIPEANIAPAPYTPLVTANEFVKTGVAFMDELLGGQRRGDCNGIIGPTGGGKTTLGVHLAVATAKQAWADAQGGAQPEIVVFITAEESALKLRPRIWSAFFQIPKTKLDTLTDWNSLTQPGHLDAYEIAMQAEQQYKMSEIERYMANAPAMANHLKVLDLSGSDEFPNAGTGYVDEITSYLSRYTVPIREVVIDYAGIFCERHMQAKGMDEKSYRYLLKTFGDRCRKEVSARFNCTTWVLHQLKGAMGQSSATKLMHHSDAGESADFANNMVVCCCLGVADKQTGCRRLNISKCRYKPTEKLIAPTLRIHDHFAIMEDVTRLYAIDGNQFLSLDEQRQVRVTNDLSLHVPVGGPHGMRDTSQPVGASNRVDL